MVDFDRGGTYSEEFGKPDPFPGEPGKNIDIEVQNASPFSWRLTMRPPAWHPPTDVYECTEPENAVVVRIEIAGMHENDFSVELNGRYLLVRGVRQDIAERRAYHQMEIRFGEFSIEIELPSHVEADQVQAIYDNGFLRIVLPKSHPRQIPIAE